MKKKVKEKKAKLEKKDFKFLLFCGVITLIFIIFAILILYYQKPATIKEAVYEESVTPDFEADADLSVEENRINLPVMPDYVITKDNPNVYIPYPKKNAYDMTLTFYEKGSEEPLYETALIAPGSFVLVPAYDFCESGAHTYELRVSAFDPDTHSYIESNISMEMDITKK